jgi:methionyl-tRNA formyltransferase
MVQFGRMESEEKMTKIVFMGTPQFAVPSLVAVAGLPDVKIIQVITQPDRPAGRGQSLQPSPVKSKALELGLPVWTPENLKKTEDVERLRDLKPDLMVVVAYGEILRQRVLDIPPLGTLNVHASLLPRHRGAAPIVGALLAGDSETGVTIMRLDAGMDTGDMLTTRAIPILPHYTTGTLTPVLAQVGAELLAETLPLWVAGQITPQPQDPSLATATRLIKKEDGTINWNEPARLIERKICAYDPWPGTYTYWKGEMLKVLGGMAVQFEGEPTQAVPGMVERHGDTIAITTGDGSLVLQQVQLAGKKPMDIRMFVNGYKEFVGSVLGK